MGDLFKVSEDENNRNREALYTYANNLPKTRIDRRNAFIHEFMPMLSGEQGSINFSDYGLGGITTNEQMAGLMYAWCMYKGMSMEELISQRSEDKDRRASLAKEFYETFSRSELDTDDTVNDRRIANLIGMQEMIRNLSPALPDAEEEMTVELFSAYEAKADMNAQMSAALDDATFGSAKNRNLLQKRLGIGDIEDFREKNSYARIHANLNRISVDVAMLAFSTENFKNNDPMTTDVPSAIWINRKREYNDRLRRYYLSFALDPNKQGSEIPLTGKETSIEAEHRNHIQKSFGRINSLRNLYKDYNARELRNTPICQLAGDIHNRFSNIFTEGDVPSMNIEEFIKGQLSSEITENPNASTPRASRDRRITTVNPYFAAHLDDPDELVKEITGREAYFESDIKSYVYINGKRPDHSDYSKNVEKLRDALMSDGSSFVAVMTGNGLVPVVPPYGYRKRNDVLAKTAVMNSAAQDPATLKDDRLHIRNAHKMVKAYDEYIDAGGNNDFISFLTGSQVNKYNRQDVDNVLNRIYIGGKLLSDIVRRDSSMPEPDDFTAFYQNCSDYLREHLHDNGAVIAPQIAGHRPTAVLARNPRKPEQGNMPDDEFRDRLRKYSDELEKRQPRNIANMAFALNLNENIRKLNEYNNNNTILLLDEHDIVGGLKKHLFQDENADPQNEFLSGIYINGMPVIDVAKGNLLNKDQTQEKIFNTAVLYISLALKPDSSEHVSIAVPTEDGINYKAVMPGLDKFRDLEIVDGMRLKALESAEFASRLSEQKFDQRTRLDRRNPSEVYLVYDNPHFKTEPIINQIMNKITRDRMFQDTQAPFTINELRQIYLNGKSVITLLEEEGVSSDRLIDEAVRRVEEAYLSEKAESIIIKNENSIDPNPRTFISENGLNIARDFTNKNADIYLNKLNKVIDQRNDLKPNIRKAVEESWNIHSQSALDQVRQLEREIGENRNNPDFHLDPETVEAAEALTKLYLLSLDPLGDRSGYGLDDVLNDTGEIRQARFDRSDTITKIQRALFGDLSPERDFSDPDKANQTKTDFLNSPLYKDVLPALENMVWKYANLTIPYVDFSDPESIIENLPKVRLLTAMGEALEKIANVDKNFDSIKPMVGLLKKNSEDMLALNNLRADYIMQPAYLPGVSGENPDTRVISDGIKAQAAVNLIGTDTLKKMADVPIGGLDSKLKIHDGLSYDVTTGNLEDVQKAIDKTRIKGFKDQADHIVAANVNMIEHCLPVSNTLDCNEFVHIAGGRPPEDIIGLITGVPVNSQNTRNRSDLLYHMSKKIFINGQPLTDIYEPRLNINSQNYAQVGQDLYNMIKTSLIDGTGNNFVMIKDDSGNFQALKVTPPEVGREPEEVHEFGFFKKLFTSRQLVEDNKRAYDKYIADKKEYETRLAEYNKRVKLNETADLNAAEHNKLKTSYEELQQQQRQQEENSLAHQYGITNRPQSRKLPPQETTNHNLSPRQAPPQHTNTLPHVRRNG